MGFIDKPEMVRVDFFSADTFKWKYTEAVDFNGLWDFMMPEQAFALAWARHGRFQEYFIAVCLEPYHRLSYPVMLNSLQRNVLLQQAGRNYHFNTAEPKRKEA